MIVAPAVLRSLSAAQYAAGTVHFGSSASNDPPADVTPTPQPESGAQPVRVRIADCVAHFEAAHALLERQYRGIGLLAAPVAEFAPDVHRVTLLAYMGERAVATLSLNFDSEAGLRADAHYAPLLEPFRLPGRLLCEFGRFAVEADVPVLKLLGPMLRMAWQIGRLQHGMTDVVVECHPRHAAFYRRLIGFRRIGDEVACQHVGGAPAVLLHLPAAQLEWPAAPQPAQRARHLCEHITAPARQLADFACPPKCSAA